MALDYVNTCFENGSPVQWEIDPDGIVRMGLLYDHERASPNRAAGHWHVQLQARAGADLTVVLENFDNIWNGQHGSPVSERTAITTGSPVVRDRAPLGVGGRRRNATGGPRPRRGGSSARDGTSWSSRRGPGRRTAGSAGGGMGHPGCAWTSTSRPPRPVRWPPRATGSPSRTAPWGLRPSPSRMVAAEPRWTSAPTRPPWWKTSSLRPASR